MNFNEQTMNKSEHYPWYQDPRVWVLIVAFSMFFFSVIEKESHPQSKQTAKRSSSYLSAPIGSVSK
jgi:hypothetical protein